MNNLIDDLLLKSVIGMTKEEFLRKAILMRNPEGFAGDRCPNCKSNIKKNAHGDMWCEKHNLNDKTSCPWHRHHDGTNYWSSINEIIDAKPEIKKKMQEAGILKGKS